MRTRNSGSSGRVIALAAVLALSMATSAMAQEAGVAGENAAQVPQPAEGGVDWPGTGYAVGAVASNVVYMPAKLVYAIAGSLFGGGAYLLTAGNSQVSDTIWRSSLGGDYVVTPDMLKGDRQLNFSGPTTTAPAPALQVALPAGAAQGSPGTAQTVASRPIETSISPATGAAPMPDRTIE